MSDTNGAPAGAADHLSASEGQDASPVSARDSVAAALAQLESPGGQESGATAGGEPRQPAMTPDARARDEQGRFARGEGQGAPQAPEKPATPAPKEGQLQPDKGEERQGEPEKATTRVPPPGWSPAGKEAYAALPEAVKADIEKREREVNAGLSELKEYRDLRPYREMAQRSGTNLGNVLGQLSAFEDHIAKNPAEAIGVLSNLYGFDIRQAVTTLAQQLGIVGNGQGAPQRAGAPAGGAAPAHQQQPAALPREVMERLARVDQIEQRLAGQQMAQMQAAVDDFAGKAEFFDNVGAEMQAVLQADLGRYRNMPPHLAMQEAYEKAVWLNPDTRAVLIKRQTDADGRAQADRMKAAADQARHAGRGLSGSPVNGATPGSAQPSPKSTRDAVAAAFDMHAGI